MAIWSRWRGTFRFFHRHGFWLDPLWKRFGTEMVPASSVPFFSAECGERFADYAGFERALDHFLDRLPSLTPRNYVAENLSMKRSAEIYADHYFSLLKSEASQPNIAEPGLKRSA